MSHLPPICEHMYCIWTSGSTLQDVCACGTAGCMRDPRTDCLQITVDHADIIQVVVLVCPFDVHRVYNCSRPMCNNFIQSDHIRSSTHSESDLVAELNGLDATLTLTSKSRKGFRLVYWFPRDLFDGLLVSAKQQLHPVARTTTTAAASPSPPPAAAAADTDVEEQELWIGKVIHPLLQKS